MGVAESIVYRQCNASSSTFCWDLRRITVLLLHSRDSRWHMPSDQRSKVRIRIPLSIRNNATSQPPPRLRH
ncbi:hypothetical protein IG631_22457 [Alternaria alternata]|nr:hypothetical protein IG631_22457 [Alternaria alternata]